MGKFCSNCGKELKENADICLNCGVLINKDTKVKKEKTPGLGLSIAGMILGILSIFAIFGSLPEAFDYDYYYSNADMISDMVMSLAICITGVSLSAVGFTKNKNGFNISGIILNSISILVNIIVLIYIICA